MACVANSSGDAYKVHIIEDGQCKFSAGVEHVFEIYGFEAVGFFEVLIYYAGCPVDCVMVEKHVRLDLYRYAVLGHQVKCTAYGIFVQFGLLGYLFGFGRFEKISFEERFYSGDDFLLGGCEGAGKAGLVDFGVLLSEFVLFDKYLQCFLENRVDRGD